MGPCIPPVDPVFQQHVWTCAVRHKQAVATHNLIPWKHISLELQKMHFCGKYIFNFQIVSRETRHNLTYWELD